MIVNYWKGLLAICLIAGIGIWVGWSRQQDSGSVILELKSVVEKGHRCYLTFLVTNEKGDAVSLLCENEGLPWITLWDSSGVNTVSAYIGKSEQGVKFLSSFDEATGEFGSAANPKGKSGWVEFSSGAAIYVDAIIHRYDKQQSMMADLPWRPVIDPRPSLSNRVKMALPAWFSNTRVGNQVHRYLERASSVEAAQSDYFLPSDEVTAISESPLVGRVQEFLSKPQPPDVANFVDSDVFRLLQEFQKGKLEMLDSEMCRDLEDEIWSQNNTLVENYGDHSDEAKIFHAVMFNLVGEVINELRYPFKW